MPVMCGRGALSRAASGRQTRITPTMGRTRLMSCLLRIWHTARFYLTNFSEALAQALLEALVGGLVVGAVGEVVGEALHVRDFVLVLVRVLVAFAVADIFHQARRRVAQVQRDGIGFGFVNVFDDFAVSGIERVGFWRERKIHGRLRERQMAFGRAAKTESVFGGERDGQPAW